MTTMWQPITTESELDSLLTGDGLFDIPCSVIFKHSSRCAISSVAKARLERKADPRLNYFIVDVLAHRDISNLLADRTGVPHESPQLFLFQHSQLIDVKSHMAISAGEISRRLDSLIQIGM